MKKLSPFKSIATASTLALALFATSCSSTSDTKSDSTATTKTVAMSQEQAKSVQISDSWVKSAESGMSAGFGILKNSGNKAVNIVGASSEVTNKMELHETVKNADGQMAMQRKEDGFTIEPGAEFTLQPGGNHLMFMDLTKPIKAGEAVKVTLEFTDGSTTSFEATAKDFSGANESYAESKTMG